MHVKPIIFLICVIRGIGRVATPPDQDIKGKLVAKPLPCFAGGRRNRRFLLKMKPFLF